MVGSLGAPLLLEHKQELIRRLPRRLYELYGLTEGFVTISTRRCASGNRARSACRRPSTRCGSSGPTGASAGRRGRRDRRPRPHRDARLPPATGPDAEALVDGWLRSGDLGYVDDDGFLYLVDRKKDLMISGGVNVYPRDIEEVAVRHPDVLDAAVFGVPGRALGREPGGGGAAARRVRRDRRGAPRLDQRERRRPLPARPRGRRPRCVPAQRRRQDAAAGDPREYLARR